jgi:MipA family protein
MMLLRPWFAALVLAVPVPAFSADGASQPDIEILPAPAAQAPDWTFTLGGGAAAAPAYAGAKELKALPFPMISLNYRDIVFASPLDGIGANLLNMNGLQAGPIAKIALPRLESDSKYLRGMGDIDTTIEAGLFAQYNFSPFVTTRVEVRRGVVSFGEKRNKRLANIGINENSKGHEGIVADLSADVRAPLLNNSLILSAGPRLSFYDEDYAQTYFGVSPNQAKVTNYKKFKPKAGIGKVGVGGTAVYRVTDQFSVLAFGDYSRLVGDVAKSPLVTGKGGSKNQFIVGAGVSYQFGY